MIAFKLVLDPETIEERTAGPSCGGIHASFSGKAFPDAGWTDFVLEFLQAYWRAVVALKRKTRSKVSFFEGPFELRFRRTGDRVEILAVKRPRDVVHRAEIGYIDLLEHSMQSVLPLIDIGRTVGSK